MIKGSLYYVNYVLLLSSVIYLLNHTTRNGMGWSEGTNLRLLRGERIKSVFIRFFFLFFSRCHATSTGRKRPFELLTPFLWTTIARLSEEINAD